MIATLLVCPRVIKITNRRVTNDKEKNRWGKKELTHRKEASVGRPVDAGDALGSGHRQVVALEGAVVADVPQDGQTVGGRRHDRVGLVIHVRID